MSTKRAVIIGSQTGGLTGVHSDAEVVDDALTGLGFTTTRCIEGEASYDGIVAAYQGLIEDSTSDDAAVVYYSGHGGRQRNALAAKDPTAPTWLQYIVPTDVEDRADGRFHAVLAQELSLLQRQLTDKTPNVTTILDCCHSARMSRSAALLPKARPAEAGDQIAGFPWDELATRWDRIREQSGGSVGAVDANPLAVRLVACSPDESAFELAETSLGGPHGALTSTLVPLLRSATATSLTWRDVVDVVRAGVMDLVPQQRPEVEGPLHRVLFTVEERELTGVLPIRVEGGVALLDGADLLGVAVGDRYAVVAPGGDPNAPLGTALVDGLIAGRARLALDGLTAAEVPAGAAAHPVEVSLGARPVAVVPPDRADRAAIVEALETSALVRVVDQAVDVVATVDLTDGVLLLDAGGEPLYADALPPSPDNATAVARDVAVLARATHVRELRSGAGDAALPADVSVTYHRLLPDGSEVELSPGEHLFNGDRLVMRCRNESTETRYASVIDVGISGTISIITAAEPDGTTLAAKEIYEVGRNTTGALEGIELYWPPSVPGDAPRPETVITIVADEKVAGLGRLEQAGITPRARSATARSTLEQMVDDLGAGRRDARPTTAAPKATRYRVSRFDFLFHPTQRPGEATEPSFDIDERPDPSFRLVVPRAARPPKQVAVRLKEVTVHSNRSILSAAVRIDTMVITVPDKDGGEPYRAATARFDRVKDGDRLPLDDLLVYDGPVGRFLDLAVWVAKADQRDRDLADLLAEEVTSGDAQSAIVTLAGLAVAAPQAAVVAGSAAAVAALVRTGGKILDSLQGKSIGVYRTSLLPHERFGAGDRKGDPGRHPADGLLRAQDMSFAYEVVAV